MIKNYPLDAEFVYRPVFPGTVADGDVLAGTRDGAQQVTVVGAPTYHQNLISRPRVITRLTVRPVGLDETVDLLLSAGETVYVRRFHQSPSHPELDSEL